jgi:hypothetical protein
MMNAENRDGDLPTVEKIPAEDIPALFKLLKACRHETEMTKRDSKKYDAIKETMMAEIAGKYNLYQEVFAKIFAERRDVIAKDFEVIDKGMRDNNPVLIQAGVAGLTGIVSSSPLKDAAELKRLLAT